MNDQRDANDGGIGRRQAYNLVMTALEGPATTLKVLTRYRFGSQQPGLAGLFGLVALLVVVGTCPPHDPRPVLAFAVLFTVALVCRRVGAGVRAVRGDEEHSWFDGYSVVGRCLPFMSEESAKKYAEPLLCLALSIPLGFLSVPLAVYLFFASFCLLFTTHAYAGIQYRQLKRMRDLYIEQKAKARDVREFIERGRL